MQEMMTVEYKRTAFDFMLMAPDRAVNSYNALMQLAYKESQNADFGTRYAVQLGHLLLEIRRNLVKDTHLDDFDMLRFLITDIETIEEQYKKLS